MLLRFWLPTSPQGPTFLQHPCGVLTNPPSSATVLSSKTFGQSWLLPVTPVCASVQVLGNPLWVDAVSILPGVSTFSLPKKTYILKAVLILHAAWNTSFREPTISAHSQEIFYDFRTF